MSKVWHKFTEEKPKKNGSYVVCVCYEHGAPWIAVLDYSTKHCKFNVRDRDSEEEVADVAIEPTYWAEVEDVVPKSIWR